LAHRPAVTGNTAGQPQDGAGDQQHETDHGNRAEQLIGDLLEQQADGGGGDAAHHDQQRHANGRVRLAKPGESTGRFHSCRYL
jgi:hypothetical protein